MTLEAYREECSRIGFIPDLAYYRGLDCAARSREYPSIPEFIGADYEFDFNWIGDFLGTLKSYFLLTKENLMTAPLVQNHECVVLDRIYNSVGIKSLIEYLSPRLVYVIQEQSVMQKSIAPSGYRLQKEVSDPQQILSRFFESSPFVHFDCQGRYRLTVLKKREAEAMTRYSILFKEFKLKMEELLRQQNFTNFNSKLRKTPIIIASQSSAWLADQLLSVVGGVRYDAQPESQYLGNYIFFEAVDAEFAKIASNAFMVSLINVETDYFGEFQTAYEVVQHSPEFAVKICVRKRLEENGQQQLYTNLQQVADCIVRNQQIPIDTNQHYRTLFMYENPSAKHKEHLAGMYEFIKALTGVEKDWVEKTIKTLANDDLILNALANRVKRLEPDHSRVTRAVKQFARFLSKHLHGMQFSNMVDLGCGDGRIALGVAKTLGIQPENVIGIDIRDIREADIQYIQSDLEHELLVPDSTCQFFTISQVLHHIRNWRALLQRIYAKTEWGGYLLIRESLVADWVDCLTLDIQHSLYAVLNEEMTSLQYVTEFNTWYIRKAELLDTLCRVGFDVCVVEKDYKHDKFNKFCILCRKRSQIDVELKE